MLLTQAEQLCTLETRIVQISLFTPTRRRKVSHPNRMFTFQSSVHLFCKGLQGLPLHFVPSVFALVAMGNKLVLFLSSHF